MLLNGTAIFSRLCLAFFSRKLNFWGRCLFLPEENGIGRTRGWRIKLNEFRSAVRWKTGRTIMLIAQRLYIKVRCLSKTHVHPEQTPWIWCRNYHVRRCLWFLCRGDLNIRPNNPNDPSGFKILVNVNDSEVNKSLRRCVVLALFCIICYYIVWFGSWNWFYSRKQKIFLNKNLFGEVTMEGKVDEGLL